MTCWCGREATVLVWKTSDGDDAPARFVLCLDHWNEKHGQLEAGRWLKDYYWEDYTPDPRADAIYAMERLSEMAMEEHAAGLTFGGSL